MKKLLPALLCCLLAASAQSQIVKSVYLSGGYASSAQVREYGNNIDPQLDPIGNFGVEAGVEFWKSKFFSFSTSAGFIKKGFKYDYPFATVNQPDGTGQNVDVRVCLNYVYIAPRFTFNYPLGWFTPKAFVAPRGDFFLSSSEVHKLDDKVIFEDAKGKNSTVDFYDKNHKAFVFGLTTGLGAEKKITERFAMGLELGYWFDFTNSVAIEKSSNNVGLNVKHQVFSAFVTARYLFGLD